VRRLIAPLLLVALILGACQPAAQPAPAAPKTEAKPTDAAKPAPSPVAAASPAASPAVAASPVASPGAAASPAAAPVAVKPSGPMPSVPGGRLSIATGGTGGVYYPLGGGMAKILSQYIPGTEATAEVTPGSVDNMFLLKDGKVDLALTISDIAFDAAEARERFRDGAVPVRSLANVYTNYMHMVTVEGSGINSIADFKGKRISVGAAGSGTEIKGNRVVESYGLDPTRDFQRERLSVAESAGAVKDRKIDGFYWDGGLPTGAVLDLASTPGLKIKLLDQSEAVAKMNEKYGPLYTRSTIPAGTYTGQDQAVTVAGVANLLTVNESMTEDLAYAILRILFEHQPELVAVHPEARNLTLETAAEGSSIPFHPGAIRFYREVGVWKGP